MATVNKLNTYPSSATITCTLASLASSATVGRCSTAVDNTSNLYLDALVTLSVKTSASALANDKAVYVYLYGSEDGTVYNSDGGTLGTDAGYTVTAPSNLKGPIPIFCATTATTYTTTFSVAQFFGGNMPRKWGVVVVNFTGQALDATEGNHQKTYTGITQQNV